MLMIKCIILICGPPACLKSTLIKILRLIFDPLPIFNLKYFCIKTLLDTFWKRTTHELKWNFVSFDDLFLNYENDIIKTESNWKSYRLLIADEIEEIIIPNAHKNRSIHLKYSSQILDRLHRSLKTLTNSSVLVIEDNFYYSSMRHRYHQIAQRAQIGFASIHLYSSITVALQRNQKRELSKRVSDLSIENIYSKYDLSNDDLMIDTTYHGLTTEHLNIILRRIQRACHEPEQQANIINNERRQLATEINNHSVMYQIDQKIRKFISKHLKQTFDNDEKFKMGNEKKVYADMINNKRQIFFELIRHKWIILTGKDEIETLFEQFLVETTE